MFSPEDIKTLLIEQYEGFLAQDPGVQRDLLQEIKPFIKVPHSIVISGLRRVGKSTFLKQVADKYFKEDDFYYINFDDERFVDFTAADFNKLHEILIELFGKRKVFFFDEIQNIDKWETFARRLNDQKHKLIITGSNAALLSRELGTRLTGRYIGLSLFPFSFKEFIDFNDVTIEKNRGVFTTHAKASLKKLYNNYKELGGIAEALKYPEIDSLQRIYTDAIYRDIIARFNIDSDRDLRSLAHFLFSNIGSPISFNALKKHFGFGSVNTVKNYIHYLEIAWLVFELTAFSPSLKKQQIAPKKIYSSDLGMAKQNGFSISDNLGAYLENFVFLELRRLHDKVYYYKTKNSYEVDFYVPEKNLLIQVSYEMNKTQTRDREIRALLEAKKELNAEELLILTYDSYDEIKENSDYIKVLPFYEYFF